MLARRDSKVEWEASCKWSKLNLPGLLPLLTRLALYFYGLSTGSCVHGAMAGRLRTPAYKMHPRRDRRDPVHTSASHHRVVVKASNGIWAFIHLITTPVTSVRQPSGILAFLSTCRSCSWFFVTISRKRAKDQR
jgi:hypothetical protein